MKKVSLCGGKKCCPTLSVDGDSVTIAEGGVVIKLNREALRELTKKDYEIKKEGTFLVVNLNEDMETLGLPQPSKKDEGIIIQPGIKVGIKTIKYDRSLYTEEQIIGFIEKLDEAECPICERHLSLVKECFNKEHDIK